MIGDFEKYLRSDEKSENTIEKYLRDVKAFCMFAEAREISKTVVMEFKAWLMESYEVTSANSMIAAVNAFLRFKGKQAGVSPDKVFPHNLRHLFARTFYGIEKDIAKLADILGHSSINTTRIYIITTGAEHKRKMENMRLII